VTADEHDLLQLVFAETHGRASDFSSFEAFRALMGCAERRGQPMRNPYAAPEPRDAAWWLLLLVVAALTMVLVTLLGGKDRTAGGHLAPVASIDGSRTPLSR
jgi:hypothetical protein